jgi:hypothetical protein
MSTDSNLPKLNPKQIRALVVLMAEARELTNNDLKTLAGDSLTGTDNAALIKLGLVETDRSHRPFSHSLTDKGWHVAREIHLTPAPSGSATVALFTVLANVHRSLDRLGISHAEFFKQGSSTVSAEPADPETAIRSAYGTLAGEPGVWVDLADLRDRLTGFSREAVDEALRVIVRQPDVRIIPVADTKNLTARDTKAAVRIGVTDNHVIAIGQ